MESTPEQLSVQKFLLETPLYSKFRLPSDGVLRLLYSRGEKGKIDGYCLYCAKETTFVIEGQHVSGGDPWNKLSLRDSYDEMQLCCSRDSNHSIRYYFKIKGMVVEKVGQYPSLADIAINETRTKYKNVLKDDNWSEFYKAMGLAAHGEGIGAFVYLRRVFERLIKQRFDEHKDKENWKDQPFMTWRMNERVEFLKDYLPPFLVENSRIYSIFSVGIHELDNQSCLDFFEIGKQSIISILEEDLRLKAEKERKATLASAIQKFSSGSA